jgi:Holliday junction resolvase RusA-like endonuclease
MKMTSPLEIYLPRKTMDDKKILINLNVYRNLHRFSENQAKKIYCELMRPQMEGLVLETPITLTYTLYKRSNRKLDRANPLCIIEKYFCDALVEHGCIPDDNDEYIKWSHYETGGVDKENYRCEITIGEA